MLENIYYLPNTNLFMVVEKVLKLTEKDLCELEEEKKRNFKQRLEFIDQYVAWLKKTPNKKWSKQQNKLLNK